MDGIDILGQKIVDVLFIIAYWVVAISGMGQTISCIAKKDVEKAVKNVVSYGGAFAAIYLFQWILDVIKGVFA